MKQNLLQRFWNDLFSVTQCDRMTHQESCPHLETRTKFCWQLSAEHQAEQTSICRRFFILFPVILSSSTHQQRKCQLTFCLSQFEREVDPITQTNMKSSAEIWDLFITNKAKHNLLDRYSSMEENWTRRGSTMLDYRWGKDYETEWTEADEENGDRWPNANREQVKVGVVLWTWK